MSDRVNDFVREMVEREALRLEETLAALRKRCESPIEELVAVALYDASLIDPTDIQFMTTGSPPTEPYFQNAAFVFQQARVGPYRADMLILDATDRDAHRWMIVECDGHDFHERTKEQARHDKKRDRFFQSRGYKVLRFTGSEIWANPEAVSDEIIEQLANNDDWRNRS